MTRDYLASYETDENGCWNYTGTIATNGYGKILQTTAHRWFYATIVGPIPDGLQLDHLCRNKRCVNPDHLEPVTNLENMRRRWAAANHCVRGHEFTPSNTYTSPRGRRECRTCRYDRWAESLGRPVYPIGRPRKAVVA